MAVTRSRRLSATTSDFLRALAYVAGQWHLADDYAIDDDEEEDGSPKPPGPLKLIRPVVMPW
ncbi:hypothetical protein ABE85_09890 [Mitsuaria sp. 7]|nr:hypothetical protein ABE85_09890 [Mitsuaria sp. 7]